MYKPDPVLEKAVDAWIASRRDELISDIVGAIGIPSVAVPTDDGPWPYGEPCARMLDYMEKKTKGYGLAYENHEYYLATSLWPGETGRYEIGLFGHTDVVPENGEWVYEPFSAVVKGGRYIVGRGSRDNKGATFAAIYAVRFLRDHGVLLQSNVRLMYGCHEESGMTDTKYYQQHYKLPDVTLVPDSFWGADVAEPGVVYLTLEADIPSGSNLVAFDVGTSEGTTAETGYALLSGVELEEADRSLAGRDRISYEMQGDLLRVEAAGIPKHAAFPDGSINPIELLATALSTSGLVREDNGTMAFLSKTLHDHDGRAVGICKKDDFYGESKHTSGMCRLHDGVLTMHFNLRYPACCDQTEYEGRILRYFEGSGYRVAKVVTKKPLLVRRDNPIVAIMCDTSSYVYGQRMEAFAQAGGTYAGETPGAISTGVGVRGRKDDLFPSGHGGAHQPDEYVEIDTLLKAIKIYVFALIEIDRLITDQGVPTR